MNLLKRFAQISSIALASAMIASCASDSSSSGSSSEAETTENPTAQQKKAEAKPSYAYAKTAFDASSDADSMSMKECQGRAGVEIKMGIDKNADGKLEGDEVAKTEYVCDGEKGAAGAAGAKGDYTKVHTVSFDGAGAAAAGQTLVKDNTKFKPAVTYAGTTAAYCQTVGGVQVNFYTESGDTAGFDAKDTVLKTTYVCNGVAGAKGDKGDTGNNAPAQLAYQAKFTKNLATGVKGTSVADVNVITKTGQSGYSRVLFDYDEDVGTDGADSDGNKANDFVKIGVLNDGKASVLENWSALGVVTNYYKTTAGTPPTVFFNVTNDLYYVNADDTAVKVDLTATISQIVSAATGVFVIDNSDGASGLFFVKTDGTVENLKGKGMDFTGETPKNIEVVGDTLFLNDTSTKTASFIASSKNIRENVGIVTGGKGATLAAVTLTTGRTIATGDTTLEKGKTGVFVIDKKTGADSDLFFIKTDGSVENLKPTGMDFKGATPANRVVIGDTLFLNDSTQAAATVASGKTLVANVGIVTGGKGATLAAVTLTAGRTIATGDTTLKEGKTGVFVIDKKTGVDSDLFFIKTDGNVENLKPTGMDFKGTAPTSAVVDDTLFLHSSNDAAVLATAGTAALDEKIGRVQVTGNSPKLEAVGVAAVTKDNVSFVKGETGIFVIKSTGGGSKLYFVGKGQTDDADSLAPTGMDFKGETLVTKAVDDTLFLTTQGASAVVTSVGTVELTKKVARAAKLKNGNVSNLALVTGLAASTATNVSFVEGKTGIFVVDKTTGADSKLYFVGKTDNAEDLTDSIDFKGKAVAKKQVVSTFDKNGVATGDKLHLLGDGTNAGTTYKDNPGIAFSSGETKHRLLNPQHGTIVDRQAVHFGGKLYFGSGSYLWESDGTKAGTKVLGKHTVTSITTDGTDVYFATSADLYKLTVSTGAIATFGGSNAAVGDMTHLKVIDGKLFGVKKDGSNKLDLVYVKSDANAVVVGKSDGVLGDVASLHVLGSGNTAKVIAVGASKLAYADKDDDGSGNDKKATEIKNGSNAIAAKNPVVAGDVLFFLQASKALFVTQGATDTTFQVKDDAGAVKIGTVGAFPASKVGSSYYVLIDKKLYEVDKSDGSAEVVDYGADSGSNLAVVKKGSDYYLFVTGRGEVFVKKEAANEVFKATNLARYGLTGVDQPTVVGSKLYFLANSSASAYFSNHGIEWFYTEQK